MRYMVENRSKEWWNVMSNLGGYQQLTTMAKKVGGPENLVIILLTTGAGIYKGSEFLIKKVVKLAKKKYESLQTDSDCAEYDVKKYGISNEGLEFEVGDEFKVLGNDEDSVLIEKKGDKNNPYFVTADFLSDISDYE